MTQALHSTHPAETPLLQVKDLVREYTLPRDHLFKPPGKVHALNGVNFSIASGRSLGLVLRYPLLTMFVFLATVILNIHLYVTIPKGFFPQQDTGQISGGIRADQSISSAAMQQKIYQLVEIIRKDPAVETVVAFTGQSLAGPEGATVLLYMTDGARESPDLPTLQALADLNCNLAQGYGIGRPQPAAEFIAEFARNR